MSKNRIDSNQEKDPSTIVFERTKGQSEAQAIARISISPSVQAALTLKDYGKSFEKLELMSLVEELRHQIGQTIDGDLDRAEAMLTAQAHALDSIFGNLARRAINSEYMSVLETYLKLGLRAQSQCRATWETLAAIKNPVGRAYVNQANFAHNQQINNATDSSRTRENQKPPNELLEKTDGERLEFGKTGTAIDADQAVETVGKVHRPKVV